MVFKIVIETTFDTREEAGDFRNYMGELDMDYGLFTQGFNAVSTELTNADA